MHCPKESLWTAKHVPVRLLVADDHDILRQGLVAVLERDPRFSVVATASNGEEAVAAFRRTQPDLAIMDLRMPVMEGPEAIRAIRAEFAQARVVVLTVYEGDVDIARALSAGAAAYVLKGMPSDELFEAIIAVHEGRQYIPPRITQVLDQAGRTDLRVAKWTCCGSSSAATATARSRRS